MECPAHQVVDAHFHTDYLIPLGRREETRLDRQLCLQGAQNGDFLPFRLFKETPRGRPPEERKLKSDRFI